MSEIVSELFEAKKKREKKKHLCDVHKKMNNNSENNIPPYQTPLYVYLTTQPFLKIRFCLFFFFFFELSPA